MFDQLQIFARAHQQAGEAVEHRPPTLAAQMHRLGEPVALPLRQAPGQLADGRMVEEIRDADIAPGPGGAQPGQDLQCRHRMAAEREEAVGDADPRQLQHLAPDAGQLGLGGISMSHTVACASSSIAIGEAFRRVRSGEATIMVTGGSDVCQSYSVLRAWEAMRVMAPGDADTAPVACRPFAADRAGFVLGEGGGVMVLEEYEHAKARGARIYAELAGFGMSADAGHMTAPNMDGPRRAMINAMRNAGVNPDEVVAVGAPYLGTGEPYGDVAAGLAMPYDVPVTGSGKKTYEGDVWTFVHAVGGGAGTWRAAHRIKPPEIGRAHV